jgi:xanthine dehydrogenase accessory factor
MKIIAQTACELLEKGESFVLATIVSHTGSTPRTSGSKMVVTADGKGIGTIGGGLLEAGAMSKAVELIALGQSAVIAFDLSQATVATMDMICGGQAKVLLDCVSPTPTNRMVFDRWRRMLDAGQQGTLLTIIMGSEPKIDAVGHGLAMSDGQVVGDLALSEPDRKQVLAAVVTAAAVQSIVFDGVFLILEPTPRTATAYLFGAGHVARATAAMAAMVGFRISVCDDRLEFANRERFPEADQIRVIDNFAQALAGLAVGKQDFVLILTRGHLHDKTVLAQALRTEAGYIGMIGSRKKRDAIFTGLRKEGFSPADIDRVYSPIGLPIGAETPEEIAVSILAELIMVRSGLQA